MQWTGPAQRIGLLVVLGVFSAIAPCPAGEPAWRQVEPVDQATLQKRFDQPVPALETEPGADWTVLSTELTPAIMVHGQGDAVRLFARMRQLGLDGPMHAAYPDKAGVKVVGRQTIDGSRFAESWLLVWFTGGQGWDQLKRSSFTNRFVKDEKRYALDIPMLISFEHRPQELTIGADGIEVRFAGQAGLIALCPLRGVNLLSPEEVRPWASGLPEQVLSDARRMNRLLKAIPLQAYERYRVDASTGQLQITYRYRFHEVKDAWGTQPIKAAPIPPAVALAIDGGMPLALSGEPIDLNAPTYLGPNWVVAGTDSVTLNVPGMLDLVTSILVPDINPADFHGNDEDARLLDEIDSALAGRMWNTGVGWWAGAGVAMEQGNKAKALPYVRPQTRQQVKAATMRLLHEMLFSGEDMVHTLVDQQRGRAYVVDHRNHFKRYAGDDEAPATEMLRGCFNYALYTGDWHTIEQYWRFMKAAGVASYVKNNWAMQSRPNSGGDTFHDVIVGTASMARMAAVLGEEQEFGLFSYLLARHLINYYGFEYAALPFARRHRPWLVPLTDQPMVAWDIYEPFGPFFAPWDTAGYYGPFSGFFEHYYRMDRDVMPRYYQHYLPRHTKSFFGQTVPKQMPELDGEEKSKLDALFDFKADLIGASRQELRRWLDESNWKTQGQQLDNLIQLYDAENPRKLAKIVAPSLRRPIEGRGIELQANGMHQNLLGLDARTAEAPGLYLFGFNAPDPAIKPQAHSGYILLLGLIEPVQGKVANASGRTPNWVTAVRQFDVIVPTDAQAAAARKQGQAQFMVCGPFGDERLIANDRDFKQLWESSYGPQERRVPEFTRVYQQSRRYADEADEAGKVVAARWELRHAGSDKAHDKRGLDPYFIDTRVKGANFGFAYVFTQVYAPRGMKVRVGFSALGPARIWINGEQVFEKLDRDKRVALDDHVFEITLQRGWNQVLWREHQVEFWSKSCFRIMDENELAIPGLVFDPHGGRR